MTKGLIASAQLLLLAFVMVGCNHDNNTIMLYSHEGKPVVRISSLGMKPSAAYPRKFAGKTEKYFYYNTGENSYLVRLDDLKLPKLKKASITYKIDGRIVKRIVNGHAYEIEAIELKESLSGTYQYFVYDSQNPYRWDWEVAGTLFFDSNGQFRFSIPVGRTDESMGVFLSANDKYIAVDSGTWIIRALTIYSFPILKPIATIQYMGSFYWYGSRYLAYTASSAEQKPWAGTDDSSYHYVCAVDLLTGKNIPLVMWDKLHSYYLEDVANDVMYIREERVRTVDDWAKSKETVSNIEMPIPNAITAN